MNMPAPTASSCCLALVLLPVAETGPATYSLDSAAELAGLHPNRLRYYVALGFFGAAASLKQTEMIFDDTMLYELRRLEHYRRHHGMNRRTLAVLSSLWREVGQLRSEVRFLRGR